MIQKCDLIYELAKVWLDFKFGFSRAQLKFGLELKMRNKHKILITFFQMLVAAL